MALMIKIIRKEVTKNKMMRVINIKRDIEIRLKKSKLVMMKKKKLVNPYKTLKKKEERRRRSRKLN